MKLPITPKNHSFARKPTTVLTVNEYGFLTPAEGIPATIDEIRTVREYLQQLAKLMKQMPDSMKLEVVEHI